MAMIDERSFERFVAGHVADPSAAVRLPDGFFDDMHATASRTGQRPEWLALIKEPPMRTNSHLVVGSPIARVAAIMVATLLLALMVAGAGIAGSRLLAADGTIVVDPDGSGTVTTITEAVAMAEDGDTILVRPGVYDESIVLDKDVTIRGDGDRADVIIELSAEMPRGDHDGFDPELPTAFLIESADATLENLTLRGESSRIVIQGGAPELRDLVLDGVGRVYLPSGWSVSGLHIHDGSAALISDSVLTDTDMIIQDSSPTLLRNTFIVGALLVHVGEEEPRPTEPVIRGNTIDGSPKWGIAIWGSARPEVVDNIIMGTLNGIVLDEPASAPVVRGNTISGSRSQGIRVMGAGGEPIIEGNVLTDNPTGISTSASNAALVGNMLSGGRVGISLFGGSPTLRDNTVDGTEQGLFISVGTTPTLEGNTVCGNETNLVAPDDFELPDMTSNEICEDAPAE